MKRGMGVLAICVVPVLLASCTTGGGPSGDYVLKKDFTALEARVASIEKGTAPAGKAGAGKAGAADTSGLESRLAALEKKVAAAPAGKGAGEGTGGALEGGLPRIGVASIHRNRWTCAKLDGSPKIDGKLDDAAWKKATQMTLRTDRDTPINNLTAVVVGHDTKKLYFGAVCMEEFMDQVKATCTKRDEQVWRDDCLEIYIDQQQDKKDATKIVVNPNGVFMDFIRLTSGDGDDVTLNMDLVASKLKDRWVIEFAFPIEDLKVEYTPGLTMRFNVMRMRPMKAEVKERSTWCGKSNDLRSLGKLALE